MYKIPFKRFVLGLLGCMVGVTVVGGFGVPVMAAAPFAGVGKGERIHIRADKLEVENRPEGRHTVAHGNVTVEMSDVQMSADAVTLDEASGLIEASGQVLMQSNGETFRGESLRYSLTDRTMEVHEGSIWAPASDLFVQAQWLWKLGPNQFAFRHARLSTCTCELPEPPAYLRATTMNVTLGKYARISWPVVYLEGVPIFVLPWAMIPVKKERQSGLLFPRFGYSRREGFRLRPSAVLIPSRATEVFLEAEIDTALGLGGNGAFRWTKGGYQGILSGTYMNEMFKTVYPAFALSSWVNPAGSIAERKASGATSPSGSRNQRWTAFTAQRADFGRWGWLRLNSTLISDTRYYEDYASSLAGLTTERVSSQAEFGVRGAQSGAALDAAVYSSVRTIDTTNLQQFPRLRIGWSSRTALAGLVPRVWMEVENDLVRSRPADFSLAPTAFTREGLNSRVVAGMRGSQEPVRGIKLWEDFSTSGYYHAPSEKNSSGQAMRWAGSGEFSLYGGRGFVSDQNIWLHIIELFAGLSSGSGLTSGTGLIWPEEIPDTVMGGRFGLRSRLQGAGLMAELSLYQARITRTTEALHWRQANRAWHLEGSLNSQLATVSGYLSRGDGLSTGGDMTLALPLPTGLLNLTAAYRYQDTPWREDNALWSPQGALMFSSHRAERIGQDVALNTQLPLWRNLTGIEEIRYSLTRQELVYWRTAVRIGSSCDCWKVLAGYTRLPAPATDRIEFAFEMIGLGSSALNQ